MTYLAEGNAQLQIEHGGRRGLVSRIGFNCISDLGTSHRRWKGWRLQFSQSSLRDVAVAAVVVVACVYGRVVLSASCNLVMQPSKGIEDALTHRRLTSQSRSHPPMGVPMIAAPEIHAPSATLA